MGVLNLVVTSARSTQVLQNAFEVPGDKHAITNRITTYLTSLQTGTESAAGTGQPPSIAISVQGNEVQASGTVTFSAVATANDTIIINGVTFTAAASAGVNQWAIGASATASAAGLAAAINASVSSLIAGYVTASSALGVCTITSVLYGLAGNTITLAEGVDAGSVMTVSGARLSGGAVDSNAQTLSF